jgi:hypothetical protein
MQEATQSTRRPMSQEAVEKALGKLITDDAFRNRFFAEPAVASVTAGLALSRVELEALSHLSQQALARFSRRLDDRIRRLAFEAAQRSAPASGLDADDDRPLAGSRTESGSAQCARPPRARDDMASLDALTQAGGGADPAEDL